MEDQNTADIDTIFGFDTLDGHKVADCVCEHARCVLETLAGVQGKGIYLNGRREHFSIDGTVCACDKGKKHPRVHCKDAKSVSPVIVESRKGVVSRLFTIFFGQN